VLVSAFAFSLLAHAFLAFFLHPPRPTREVVQTRGTTEPIPMREVRRTSPPRTPAPRRSPTIAVPQVLAALSQRHAPLAQPSPASAPTAAASPAATQPHAGSCTRPDAPAGVVAVASPPDIPAGVRAQDLAVTAAVRVQLDPSGAVTSASIEASTNSPSFDALAIEMARDTQYSPARHECKGMASSYVFRVQWAPW